MNSEREIIDKLNESRRLKEVSTIKIGNLSYYKYNGKYFVKDASGNRKEISDSEYNNAVLSKMHAPIDHQEEENKTKVYTPFGTVTSSKDLFNSIKDKYDFSDYDKEDHIQCAREIVDEVESMADPDYYLDYVDTEEELKNYVEHFNGMLDDLDSYLNSGYYGTTTDSEWDGTDSETIRVPLEYYDSLKDVRDLYIDEDEALEEFRKEKGND